MEMNKRIKLDLHPRFNPKQLQALAVESVDCDGNNLIHRIVKTCSQNSISEMQINATLRFISPVPASTVNALNKEGYSPFHLAVLYTNLFVMKKLLYYFKNIGIVTKGGVNVCENNALHLAAQVGNTLICLELLEIFEDRSADVNVKNLLGNTPYYIAVENGNMYCARLIINFGGNALAKNVYGWTALFAAVIKDNANLVAYCANLEGDVNTKDEINGDTALIYAVKYSVRLTTIKKLMQLGARLDYDSLPKVLKKAALLHRRDMVRYFFNYVKNGYALPLEFKDDITCYRCLFK